MKKILLIDSSEEYAKKLKRALQKENEFFTAREKNRALLRICQAVPDVIILCTNLGTINPLTFLGLLKILIPEIPVIVLDRNYSTTSGKIYRQEGASEYIRKSENPEILVETVKETLSREIPFIRSDKREILNEIIGLSRAVSSLKMNVLKYANIDHPVLLLGESGTGKDLVAHCIHRLSRRRDNRYLNVNCGAIPQSLIESELFGSEKGAFTDAKPIPGKFEQASGGTLFLNEICELPVQHQVKLLKILESKTVLRLGGQHEKKIDTRVITATNRDIKKAVREKHFREDLLYRINTVCINVPPLRKRKEDIQLIAESILKNDPRPKQLHINALEKLMEYNWPGNIRELINVLERAKVDCIDEIIRSSDIRFF